MTRRVLSALCALALLLSVPACGRDTMAPIPSEPPAASTPAATAAQVGDTVAFGTQDGEPLLWRVLAQDGGDALLFAEGGVREMMYFGAFADADGDGSLYGVGVNEHAAYPWDAYECTWETCDVRAWLNGEFYNDAFNDAETAKIRLTDVISDENPHYVTYGGANTQDYVFLLSYTELERYIAAHSEVRTATDSLWWLRTPGNAHDWTMVVWVDDGNADVSGSSVVSSRTVRPALWVEIDALAVVATPETPWMVPLIPTPEPRPSVLPEQMEFFGNREYEEEFLITGYLHVSERGYGIYLTEDFELISDDEYDTVRPTADSPVLPSIYARIYSVNPDDLMTYNGNRVRVGDARFDVTYFSPSAETLYSGQLMAMVRTMCEVPSGE